MHLIPEFDINLYIQSSIEPKELSLPQFKYALVIFT